MGGGSVGPDAARHGEHVGDEVVRGAGVDGQHGAHQAFQGIGVAAHHGLEGVDHRRTGHNDVSALVGGAAVAGDAVEGDDKVALARHHRPLHDGDLSGGQLGPVVEAEETVGFGGQLAPQAVVDHGLGTLGDLLGGLEEEDHVACQLLPPLGQQAGGAVQTHGVKVMAAAVHQPVALGHRPVVGGLLLGDGVDIRPEGHGLAGAGPPQNGHHAGVHAQINELQTQGGQLFLQNPGGAHLLEAQLGVAVQIVLHGPQLGLQGLGLLQQCQRNHTLSIACTLGL